MIPVLLAISLVTTAEASHYQRTGRYDEVVRLCHALAQTYPQRARCLEFGKTPEGRPMVAVIAADGPLEPAAGRPALLIQGGIHAGEIEGKDASFAVLREVLAGKVAPGLLGRVALVLVPVFNVDGHERFGPNNRPNQRGPREMGFRTTAQNLNLNRDYVKADAPEMQAMLALFGAWDPVVYVDLHTTDGAKFEPDVSVLVDPVREPRNDKLAQTAATLSAALQRRLTALGHLPLDFYPSFVKNDDPSSGFAVGIPPPRFSNAYAPARNRLAILIETHSWKTYAQRVQATHDALVALFERAREDAAAWRAACDDADTRAAALAGHDVPLAFEPTEASRGIEFRGYAYERKPSEISGQSWIRYDEGRPQIWRVPFFEALKPTIVARAPRAGYVIPAGWAAIVGGRLTRHGIQFRTLPTPATLPVETFRATTVKLDPPFEGRTGAHVQGAWRRERRTLAAGSLFVPIAQARARLILHLLEPTGPDSLVSWGFMNGVFEQKEYMEAYVTEEEARKMLARNPRLKREFEDRLAADPAFAKDSTKRLAFFSERHPSWDEQKNLIPIFRVDRAP